MTDKRYKFGFWISVIWVFGMLGLLFIKRADIASMQPNAWGDFFAGAFAPLAFLWLVLGYLQQGEELRLSTEALRLQADELRNSVEQQAALVEVSRLQLDAEREASIQEREARDHQVRPVFVFRALGTAVSGDGVSLLTFEISNTGQSVTDFRLFAESNHGRLEKLLDLASFKREFIRRFNIDPSSADPTEAFSHLMIEYVNAFGQRRSVRYVGRLDQNPYDDASAFQAVDE
ncbi:hypothetical protein [Ideonella sp.]|jgi:hypothetical protein|uniref:hypothetical protein n=1 Tax=Ideonella sp. TaxID=1929293 RepID=UPI0037C0907B